MKLGIITPVGPGHEKIIDRCNLSISEAQTYGLGPFRSIERIIIDDTEGQLGRSAARNLAIFQALELQCDWIYFIDADDVMVDTAFVSVGKYLSRFDAIWGQIFETPSDDLSLASKRPNQLAPITKLFDILINLKFYLIINEVP